MHSAESERGRERSITRMPCDNRVFRRTDWAAAGVVVVVAMVVYLATLAPTVTLEQSGAFVVAGQYFGVGRVPGYPLWHLLARLFISVFGFVRYRGCPNPAWATNLMSAVFGALSCGVVSLLVARVGRAVLSPTREGAAKAFVAALAAGMLVAASPVIWSQSVITETHTLTLFSVLLFLAVALAWLSRPNRGAALGLATAFGLGLAQSHMVILLVPCLLLAMLLGDLRLCREFCTANLCIWIVPCLLFRIGLGWPWFYVVLALCPMMGIVVVMRFSVSGRTALTMLAIIALGISFYLYLPLASEGNPPMQFGYARTWEGFQHVITRGQYERMNPTPILSLQFLEQLRWYGALLNQQFIFPLLLVALCPLICISRFRGPWLKWWAVCLLTFFMFSVVLVIGSNPRGDIQDSFIQRVRFIPSFALWGVFIGLGFALLLDWIDRVGKRRTEVDPLMEGDQSGSSDARSLTTDAVAAGVFGGVEHGVGAGDELCGGRLLFASGGGDPDADGDGDGPLFHDEGRGANPLSESLGKKEGGLASRFG